MSDTDYCVVFITASGREEAERLGAGLLRERLVACANLVPEVSSWFWWQQKIDSASECLLVCKTKRSALERLGEVVRAAHSYEVPEIIALPILWGSPSYLAWIEAEVKG